MWQAGAVVTRCSLHVRLVPSEPWSRVRAGQCRTRLQARSPVFQTGQAGSIPACGMRCKRVTDRFDSGARVRKLPLLDSAAPSKRKRRGSSPLGSASKVSFF